MRLTIYERMERAMVMADLDIYARVALLRVTDRRYRANLPSWCSALRAEGFRVYGSQ